MGERRQQGHCRRKEHWRRGCERGGADERQWSLDWRDIGGGVIEGMES